MYVRKSPTTSQVSIKTAEIKERKSKWKVSNFFFFFITLYRIYSRGNGKAKEDVKMNKFRGRTTCTKKKKNYLYIYDEIFAFSL